LKQPVATKLMLNDYLSDHDIGLNDIFKEPLLLQIGFNKTATTFLYELYSCFTNTVTIQGARYNEFNYFADYVVYTPDEEFDVKTAKVLFIIGVNAVPSKRCDIFMHESLTFRYYNFFCQKRVIIRLSKIFLKSKVLIGTRNQCDWLVSHWGQYLKGGGLLNLKEFANLMIARQNSDLHMTHFGYIAQQMRESFGEERVFIYDIKSVKKYDLFIKNISRFLDNLPYKINPIKDINTASSSFELNFLRISNHLLGFDCGAHPYSFDEFEKPNHILSKIFWKIRFFYKYGRLKALNYLPKLGGNKQKLTQSQSDRINKIFHKSNTLLAKHLNQIQ
jgi:hypothetical protein